jgi:hypothetical protein
MPTATRGGIIGDVRALIGEAPGDHPRRFAPGPATAAGFIRAQIGRRSRVVPGPFDRCSGVVPGPLRPQARPASGIRRFASRYSGLV